MKKPPVGVASDDHAPFRIVFRMLEKVRKAREAGEPLPCAWLGRRRVESTFHALRERIYDY
jgi:hypothetical protein